LLHIVRLLFCLCGSGDLQRKPSAKVVPFEEVCTSTEEEKQGGAGGGSSVAGGISSGSMHHVTSYGSLHSEDMDMQTAGTYRLCL